MNGRMLHFSIPLPGTPSNPAITRETSPRTSEVTGVTNRATTVAVGVVAKTITIIIEAHRVEARTSMATGRYRTGPCELVEAAETRSSTDKTAVFI